MTRNKKKIHGIEPSTTIHVIPLHHHIAWGNHFTFTIYTTINEKMTSQNELG